MENRETIENNWVEIIVGSDLQYHCYVNRKMWGIGFTFFEALENGIENFTNRSQEKN